MLEREVSTMELQSGNPRLTARQRAGLAWLARRATGVRELRVFNSKSPNWTLASVLLALQGRGSMSPPGPDLHLSTGDLTVHFCNISNKAMPAHLATVATSITTTDKLT